MYYINIYVVWQGKFDQRKICMLIFQPFGCHPLMPEMQCGYCMSPKCLRIGKQYSIYKLGMEINEYFKENTKKTKKQFVILF